MHDATFLILRWQVLALRNAAATLWSRHRFDTLYVAAGGLFLLVHEAGVLRTELAYAARTLAPPLNALAAAACGAGALAGGLAGRAARLRAASCLRQPWLLVQPVPGAEAARMIRCGCWLPGLAWVALAMAVLGLLFSWAPPLMCLAIACAGSAATGLGFTVAVRLEHAHGPGGDGAGPRGMPRKPMPAWLARIVAAVDRARPAWAGSWAMARWRRRTVYLWLTGTGGIAAAGLAVAIAQDWPHAAAAGAVAGAHGLFLATCNCRPLTSPVLRAQPVGFLAAVGGVLRASLLLSLLVFAVTAVIARLAASAPLSLLGSAAGVLLLLNALAAAVAAALPRARGAAWLIYAGALWLTLYERLEYGDGIFLCLAAFGAFMARQGRREFAVNV